MIDKIFGLLEALSDELIGRIVAKHESLGKPEGGIAPLTESLKNLSDTRNLLVFLIEKNKLQPLPITLQVQIHSSLTAIQTTATNIEAGHNQFAALTQIIENLYFIVWQNRLVLMGDAEIEYAKK